MGAAVTGESGTRGTLPGLEGMSPPEVAAALRHLPGLVFFDTADHLPASYGAPLSEADFAYTWEWFQSAHDFWLRAAEEGRYVLFTADQ